MTRPLRSWAALAAAALLGAGCAGGSPTISSIVVDAQDVPKNAEVVGVTRDVEVRVVNHIVFWVPTRTNGPSLSEAVDEALERGNGQVLTNASARRIAWYVPLVYGEYGWEVRGDVLRLRKPPPPEPASP
jgi:hypothetical protein